jgi:quercetin dioxygenase-like cupin family protein
MALRHAASGEVVDVTPFGGSIRDHQSTAIVRDDRIEVMRLVLIEGRGIPEHSVDGPVTFHCLEGSVELEAGGVPRTLKPGRLVYLEPGVRYTLRPLEDASILMTVVRC